MIVLDEYKAKLSEFEKGLDKLYTTVNILKLKDDIKAGEAFLATPEAYGDRSRMRAATKSVALAKERIAEYSALKAEYDNLAALIELADELGTGELEDDIVSSFLEYEKNYTRLKVRTMLSGEYDSSNAILTFHAGAGGTEAQDWVQMLYRMYTRYAQRQNYKIKVLNYLDGDEAGIKSASILVEGEYAYGYLKGENGVHRLVRISPFDASGRRHTSFASLEVVPELSDDSEVVIKDEDIRVDTYRASGAGGQHINKTESAVRITHIPTGVVVACQNERSQHKNREMAMKMLKSKLVKIKEQAHLSRIEDIKGDQLQIGWGSQIRSYVFMPYTLVKDHRTGCESGNINAVMDGQIEPFINACLLKEALKQ